MRDGPASLRKKREQKKLTMAQLAERIGTSGASVSRWENRKRVPDARGRIALKKLMGIPIEAWEPSKAA